MAQFPILRLTRAGQDLAGMSQGGGKLIFVRAELGDGQLGEGESVEMLHALKRRVMQLPLQGYLNEGNGKARLRFVVDNSSLTAGFFNREIGIVAKMEGGDEQLYAYTNAGNYADYIPSKDTPIDSEIIDLHILIGNASHVVLETQNGAYATKIELEEHRTAAELDHPEKSVRKKHLHPGAYESPALTGIPTAPTASKGTSTDQIASTAFVAQAIAALVNSAPGTLDTLQEIAAALGNDANFAASVTNALARKVSKSGDTMTGPLEVPKINFERGYIENGSRDTGDAIQGNGGANVNLASWYGLGYYDKCNGRYTGTMDLRSGNWRTVGKMRADQGFEGNLTGTASNSNTLGGQPLQWIIDQIGAAKTGIVASNLAENGWVKFANGLIVQWGIVKNGNGTQRASFPISFGRKVFHINFSSTILSNEAITNSSVQSYSLTGAELYANTSPAGYVLWFAIGI